MQTRLKFAALTAAAGVGLVLSAPAGAVELPGAAKAGFDMAAEYKRDRGRHEGWHRGRGNRDRYDVRYDNDRRGDYRYDDYRYRSDRVRYDTRVWRGNDGRYYCRRDDGTTGLLVGAAVGGLIGNEVSGRGDKTIGTVLGAVLGGLAGREIDRSDASCR